MSTNTTPSCSPIVIHLQQSYITVVYSWLPLILIAPTTWIPSMKLIVQKLRSLKTSIQLFLLNMLLEAIETVRSMKKICWMLWNIGVYYMLLSNCVFCWEIWFYPILLSSIPGIVLSDKVILVSLFHGSNVFSFHICLNFHLQRESVCWKISLGVSFCLGKGW